jgi:hypothetical protein
MKAKIKDLLTQTFMRFFAGQPMQMVHIKVSALIIIIGLLIAGGLMQVI